MKKLYAILFICSVIIADSVYGTNSVITNNESPEAECRITMNMVSGVPEWSYIIIYFNGVEEIFEYQNGVLQGSANIVKTVTQGSKAELEFYISVQPSFDYVYNLFINDEYRAKLREYYNDRYIYTIDTSVESTTLNIQLLYEYEPMGK
ncbi:MAG: hypothetical protein LIP08_12300 [Bacteroides sp.]|nr:hypothetical protein [Bacteroides sp.]